MDWDHTILTLHLNLMSEWVGEGGAYRITLSKELYRKIFLLCLFTISYLSNHPVEVKYSRLAC